MTPRIGLLGFGEVGQMLAADMAHDVCAYDIQFDNPQSGVFAAAHRAANVDLALAPAQFEPLPEIVISAVTAGQTRQAAESLVPFMAADCWYVDVNSAAPVTKQHCAQIVNAAGGKYVEASVMSAVSLKRLATPILLGGPHAKAFLPVAEEIGLSGVSVFADSYGPASAVKMCRSVLIKGLEAILGEALLAARAYDVDAAVLASLEDVLAGPDWCELAKYAIERSVAHGGRRAEEMHEAAETVRAAGLEPFMAQAAQNCQRRAASCKGRVEADNLGSLLDSLSMALEVRDAGH